MGLFSDKISFEDHQRELGRLGTLLNEETAKLTNALETIKLKDKTIADLKEEIKSLEEQNKSLQGEIVILEQTHKQQVEELKQQNLVARGLTKRKIKNSILQVRLNFELKQKLRSLAEQKDITLSEVIKEFIINTPSIQNLKSKGTSKNVLNAPINTDEEGGA